MKITTAANLDKKQELLFLGLFEEDKDNYKSLSEELAKELSEAQDRKAFSKKFGETYSTKVEGLPYKKVVLLGLGAKKEMNVEKLRQALGKIAMAAKGTLYTSIHQRSGKSRVLGHFNLNLGRLAEE